MVMLNFGKYLNDNWDAEDFCQLLAMTARNNVLSEMAMGAMNVNKIPYMYDASDAKFLEQFPPDVWDDAITWRHHFGIVEMMKFAEHNKHVPEDFNWRDSIEFPKSGGREGKQIWGFGVEAGGEAIWTGLSDLALKMVKPEKIPPHLGDNSDKAYYTGEGPGLHEIDPNQTDPEHHQHPRHYKHGYYGYDLSDMAEVTPEDIDAMPDKDVYDRLSEKFRLANPFNEKSTKQSPKVTAKLNDKRKRMKAEPKTTAAGWSPLQKSVATESMSNWFKLQALGLLGNVGNKHEDKDVSYMPITHFLSNKQAPNADKNFAPQAIPVIKKEIPYVIKRPGKPPVHKVWGTKEGEAMPVLLPAKGIPAPKLTSDEKLALIRKRAAESKSKELQDLARLIDPSQSYQENHDRIAKNDSKTAQKFAEAARPGTTKYLLDNWHIFSPETQQNIKSNMKSLPQIAQSTLVGKHLENGVDPETGRMLYDPKADATSTSGFYTTGYAPNKGVFGSPPFDVPKDKISDFINTYLPKIELELVSGGGEGGQSILGWVYNKMKNSGKYSPQVLETMDSLIHGPALPTFLAYMLLPYFTDPKYGIKDEDSDKFGLLRSLPEDRYNAEGNRQRRANRVYAMIASISQYAGNGMRSRRRRMGSWDTSAVRSQLHSTEGPIARGSTRVQAPLVGVEAFLGAQRKKILSNLDNNPKAVHDLEDANSKIITEFETAAQMYQDYTDAHPDVSDEEIAKFMKDNLAKKLKADHPAMFGDMEEDSLKHDELLHKVKNNLGSMVNRNEMKTRGDKFISDLMTKGVAQPFRYNAETKEIETEGLPPLPISRLPNNPTFIISLIEQVYEGYPDLAAAKIKEVGKELYAKVLESHGTRIDEKAINDAWNQALAAWGHKHQPQPAMPASTAPVTSQPKMAARTIMPIGVLFGRAAKIESAEEAVKVANDLLARRDELLSDKSLGPRFMNAVNAMKGILGGKGLYDATSMDRIRKLTQLEGEMNAKP